MLLLGPRCYNIAVALHAGCPAYGAAVVASLRALAEAGKMQDWNVPSLLQMQQELHASICRGSVKRMEVAYSEGSNVTNIPAPLCQHGDTQLQLWYEAALRMMSAHIYIALEHLDSKHIPCEMPCPSTCTLAFEF